MGNLHQPQAGKEQHGVVEMGKGFPDTRQRFIGMPPKQEKADIEHQNGDGNENLMAVFYKQILHSGRTLLFLKEASILPQTFILDVTFQTPTNTAGGCGG